MKIKSISLISVLTLLAGTASANAGVVADFYLGAMAGAGGLAGLFGVRPGGNDPEDRPVTRYEMGLITENTLLKANQYSDNRANGLQQQISNQAVWNATQEGALRCQAEQIARLYSLTQLVVPNANVMPGWGPVTVVPTPPTIPVSDPGTVAKKA